MEESDADSDKPLVFINGRVENPSGSCVDSEGCLSLPGIRINVERYESIQYSYLDSNNYEIENFFPLTLRLRKFQNLKISALKIQ